MVLNGELSHEDNSLVYELAETGTKQIDKFFVLQE
jgi:hypothetical protein